MGYPLFLLVTAIIFIRPTEIFADLQGVQLYFYTILICLLASVPDILKELEGRRLARNPITVCVLGVWVGAVLSQIAQGSIYDARVYGFEFLKVISYYLLLVSLITTTARLHAFLAWLLFCVSITTTLILLNFHGAISLPALDPYLRREMDSLSGQPYIIIQLRGSGIFNDPNDLCLLLSTATIITLYFLGNRRLGPARIAFLGPLGLFGYGIALTRSRGGFLAMAAGIFLLLVSRYGGRRGLALAGLALPILFTLFAGRQTDISTSEGTSQQRIQFWAEGLELFRGSPIFGIGMHAFQDEIRHVAHNSFVHLYTELGLFGATFFVGAFYLPMRLLYKLGHRQAEIHDVELRRLRHYLLASLGAYMMGLLSLSRGYTEPTYMMIGLTVVYLRNPAIAPLLPELRFDGALYRGLLTVSTVFLVIIYVFVRLTVRW